MANTSSDFDYPFDPTGVSPANKITNEIGVLTPVNFRDYNLFVPRYAPFFADSVTMTFRDTSGVVVPLVEGVDYYFGYWYIGASRACAKPVYGSIQFLNTSLAGTLTLGYQTIGGRWTLAEADITTILSDRLENPRLTSWEQVTGVPLVFPVVAHVWDLIDQVGLSDVVAGLTDIANQLRQQGGGGLADHIADKLNPHDVTKAQVGLSDVRNLATSDQASAEAGLSNDLYMTPLSTMWAMQKNIITPFTQHVAARNPHGTTAGDVGTYSAAQIDSMLQGKLSSTGVAYDSQRLQGMAYPDLRDAILQGTAANSIKFDGYTFQDYMTYVLTGTAANSQMFNSLTYAQMLNQLDARYGGAGGTAAQVLFDYSGLGTGAAVWMNLGTAKLPDPSTVYTPSSDLIWNVSGISTADKTASVSMYVRAVLKSNPAVAGFMSAIIMDGDVTTDGQIGWVVSADGLTVTFYLKSTVDRNHVTITELSKGVTTFGGGTQTLAVEPVGIHYTTPTSFVTALQLSSMMTGMTTAFNELTAALNVPPTP